MTPIPTPTEKKNRRQRPAIGNRDARPAAGLDWPLEHKTGVVITENAPWSAVADRPKHRTPISRDANTKYRHNRRRYYPHSAHENRA